jgi:hypothetical protein
MRQENRPHPMNVPGSFHVVDGCRIMDAFEPIGGERSE